MDDKKRGSVWKVGERLPPDSDDVRATKYELEIQQKNNKKAKLQKASGTEALKSPLLSSLSF